MIIPALAILLLISCATFRSDIKGRYNQPAVKNPGADPVSAFFLFTHLEQTHGLDAIPKYVSDWRVVKDFNDIFRDALGEFSNIGRYSTFTELASDVNNPGRRAEKDSLKMHHRYTIHLTFLKEKKFVQYYLAGLISTVSLTVIPMPFSWDYSVNAQITGPDGRSIGHYQRQAALNKWVQFFLLVAYPFYPEERQKEEIYVGFLHDIFRQMESEKILQ